MTRLNLQNILTRLSNSLDRDEIVQETLSDLRLQLDADRVVLYYFYRPWEGQVTFEALRDRSLSIFGCTGPDECFNGEYATLYLEGRVRAVGDIETAAIEACHRDFLRSLNVRANLAVPIIISPEDADRNKQLWGLAIAHQCYNTREWSVENAAAMQKGAARLANSEAICQSLSR